MAEVEDQTTGALEVDDAAPGGAPAPREGSVSKETPEEKKARKEAEKAARIAARGQKAAVLTAPHPSDPHGSHYGDTGTIQSQDRTEAVWTEVGDLTKGLVGQTVRVRARLALSRGQGKSAFLVLRSGLASIQATVFADDASGGSVSKFFAKYAQQVPRESVVDAAGTIVAPAEPVEACTQRDVELKLSDLHVVSRAAALPFELADAARPRPDGDAAAQQQQQEQLPGGTAPDSDDAGAAAAAGEGVGLDTRLNFRHLSLRTPAAQATFRLQAAVCSAFRASLSRRAFVEIHTPKLIGGSSEGGSEVFTFQYFGQPGCLAQSPQLYKQMAICADFRRVFEVGPVFRAENSFTHRHMCEFTGLDLEMEIHEHYAEVMDVLEEMFGDIFGALERDCQVELEAIGRQYPFEPFVFKPLRLPYSEGVQMLRENGYPDMSPLEDINTEQEKALGRLVRARHATDFYILYDFPLAVRPFYTMPSPRDPALSNSFDVFMRGEEIISGAQRVHLPDMLTERAAACGIDPATIRPYIDAFRLGAPPHGGAGVGLERVVMLYLGLPNIRHTSMFPRDPRRLAP